MSYADGGNGIAIAELLPGTGGGIGIIEFAPSVPGKGGDRGSIFGGIGEAGGSGMLAVAELGMGGGSGALRVGGGKGTEERGLLTPDLPFSIKLFPKQSITSIQV